MRKTSDIKELKRWANSILLTPEGQVTHITKDFKDGICTMIEKILHDAGAYRGFLFVNNNDSDFGTYGYVTRVYL